MRRLIRFSLAAGGGAFLISVFGLGLYGAFVLAVITVGFGWLGFALAQLTPEFRTAIIFTAEVAGEALQIMRRPAEVPDETGDQPEPEPARLVRGTSNGRLYPLQVSGEIDADQRLRSFVLLGARVGGFKSRDLDGRKLSTGEVIDFKLWRRLTDDLCAAGVASKDKKNGCQLKGDLKWVFERLEAAKRSSAALQGEVLRAGEPGAWPGA